jgi:hypothetical protein
MQRARIYGAVIGRPAKAAYSGTPRLIAVESSDMRCNHVILMGAVIIGFALGSDAASTATIAYYRFENGSAGAVATGAGTVLDSAANPVAGSPSGGPHYTSNAPVTAFPNALAMDFDGTNQMVAIPDNPKFALTQSLTVEAFVNISSVHTGFGQYIFFRGDDHQGYDPYTMQVFMDGSTPTFRFEVTNEFDSHANASGAVPSLGTWHHVAGTLDNSSDLIRLYVDGVLVDTEVAHGIRPFATLDPAPAVAAGLGIANVQDPNYPLVSVFNGRMDEVRLSDVSLTPSQMLVPEPAASAMAAFAALGAICRRRARNG